MTGESAAHPLRREVAGCDNCGDGLSPENLLLSVTRQRLLCDYCRAEEESCGCADPD